MIALVIAMFWPSSKFSDPSSKSGWRISMLWYEKKEIYCPVWQLYVNCLTYLLTRRFYRVENWPTLCRIGILCQILNITSELLWIIINNELRQQLGLTRVILKRIRVTRCQLSYLGISNTVANMVFEILKILCYYKKMALPHSPSVGKSFFFIYLKFW